MIREYSLYDFNPSKAFETCWMDQLTFCVPVERTLIVRCAWLRECPLRRLGQVDVVKIPHALICFLSNRCQENWVKICSCNGRFVYSPCNYVNFCFIYFMTFISPWYIISFYIIYCPFCPYLCFLTLNPILPDCDITTSAFF